MKITGQIISFCFIILGSGYFGFMHQIAEMGLAIIAGSISLAFLNLDKFERFSGAGFEAELKKNIEVIVEAQTEPAPNEASDQHNLEEIKINDLNRDVLMSLNNPKYTWRYTAGIAEEKEIPRNRVHGALEELSSQGLVIIGNGKKGLIWALTAEGRDLIKAKRW